MRLHRLTNYLLNHRSLALALTFFSTFIPLVGIVGILYAALVTLRKGALEGAIFTFAATCPYSLSVYFSGNQDILIPLGFWMAIGVAVLSNVLTWIFAVMLRRQATWSQVLQTAALIGVLGICIVHSLYPDVADWWGEQLLSVDKVLTSLVKSDPIVTTETKIEAINITKYYATGILVWAILISAVLQLIVARWWQAIVYSPGMLRRELHNIRLSPLAGVLFVLSLVLSYFGNRVVLDIMLIIYSLFGAAGLSLIHYLFGMMRSQTRWFWISLMYITLVFAMPTSLYMVSLLALFDIWFDVRKRLRKV